MKEPYQFQYPGETENIPAEWGTGEGYTPPRYVYEVDVLGVKSISTDAKQKGRLRFVDDLSVQVVEHESGAPYPNRNAELTLADGSTRTGSTDGAGRIELEAVPPGPAKVNLPDLGTPAEQAERGREPSETVSIRAESTAPAVVATGTPWRIDVRREKRPATL